MWCSKMEAQWRGKDVDLKADSNDFVTVNTPNKPVLSRGDVEGVDMDSQSCTDHSILSIFDDPTVAPEGKSGVEEENESLLSALTEMLDSVEDEDGTLSPFDVLPDTKLLTSTGSGDISVVNLLSGGSTPGPKSPSTMFTNKRGKKEDKNKMQCSSLPQMLTQQSPTASHSKTEMVEREVEVFTSTSLINLVKLMHPYCLKLHVEEESTQRKNCTLFTEEEVWRYERPTEESDEEINVVSDDEEIVKEKGKGERDEKRFLKSVLVNGNSPRAPPSRKKKRVSFGPIQVVSFNTSEEESFNETGDTGETVSLPLNSPKALVNSAAAALEHQTTSSEMKCDKEDAVPPKGETKAKSLSLQQYRQLRQTRQPLVEKKSNNTTKWPSVPEPPKELPPILCLEGQRQNSCGQKTAPHHPDLTSSHHQHIVKYKSFSHHVPLPLRPSSSHAKPSNHLHCSKLKPPKPESKSLSPASPLPDAIAQPPVKIPKSIKSPVKKPTLVSSDPPNPALVPLPVCQTSSPATTLLSSESKVESPSLDSDNPSSTPPQKSQQKTSASSLQKLPSSSQPKPQLQLVNKHGTNLPLGSQTKLVSDVSSRCPPPPQTQSYSEKTKLEPKTPHSPSAVTVKQIRCPSSTPHSTQPISPTDAPIDMKRAVPSPEQTQAILQVECPAQSAISDSGIEATDLTSLLEQFEKTQDKEQRICENEMSLISTTPPSHLQTSGHLKLHGSLSLASKKTSGISTTSTVESLELESLRNMPQLKPLEHVDVPEPLGTEIILSTQQVQPVKRKNSTSKAIQIIDPRPLPPRKTHFSTSEPPAAHTPPLHMYVSVCSDHDYCGPMDHSLTGATQRSRTKPSPLKDVFKITKEFQVNSQDSGAAASVAAAAAAAAAAEWKTQTSTGQTKCVSHHHSEQLTARSKTNSFTEEALHFSDCAAAATGDNGQSDDKAVPYTLPTPPPSPPNRGRERRRYRRRSPRSDSSSSSHSSSSSSSSSSTSPSPKRQRLHHRRSDSSSCSSSPCRSISRSPPRRYTLARSRLTCSRSRSRSWSQSTSPSRSRSPSPRVCLRRWKDVYGSRETRRLRREHEMRIQKLKAIDERRVVYVGRIRRSMTHDELRERFSQFGEVECVSLHFRDRGDHYGFVTFYNMDDAFAAIDNGYKLRKPDELPFDLCFGGRRQFCNSNYFDLDASRDTDTSPAMNRFNEVDFDSLLKQAQSGLKR